MAALGKELPLDILMRIFGFLPVPSLCRLRVVCKQWNALIDSSEFGTLRALAPQQRFYVLLTPSRCCNSDAGWCVLDVADERFYNLDSSYLVDYAKRENPTGDKSYSLDTVDTSGGLFLVSYRRKDVSQRLNVLYVCHPVTKTLKQLPRNVNMAHELILPILTVDYSTKTYKVICLGEQMHMYDSRDSEWSELANPPNKADVVCSAVCNNIVYTVFGERSCHMLLTYNLLEDAWSNEVAELPYNSFVQLVVVSGEVYLVAGSRTSCFCGQEMCLKSFITISKIRHQYTRKLAASSTTLNPGFLL